MFYSTNLQTTTGPSSLTPNICGSNAGQHGGLNFSFMLKSRYIQELTVLCLKPLV
jgi:hypothetical protein